MLVGTIGNGGLEPGTHEYRDDNGEKAVQGNNCYLVVNRADPSTQSTWFWDLFKKTDN